MVSLTLLRELAPVVAALLFAGRAGSALTAEIGLMKAMGLSDTKVFTLFSVEAIMIGLWGSILGVLAAMGVGSIINSLALDTFLKGMDGFHLTQFNIANVSIVIVIIMIISFLAGTLPSKKAAKQDPIDALRYE